MLLGTKMLFYKGVLESDLKPGYVPGTVTKVFKEALMWKERIESSKKKGAAKHVRHGKAVIVEIIFDGEILDACEFQRAGVKEHDRLCCWTSVAKDKAQVNQPVAYRVLTETEIDKLYTS